MSQPHLHPNRLDQEHHRRGLAYWREQLTGASVRLPFPADFSQAATPTSRSAECGVRFSQTSLQELEQFGREAQATPTVVLLASFLAVLYRYSAETDLIIGAPLGRQQPADSEGANRFSQEILPLRVDLSANPPFRDVVERVRDTVLTAQQHQRVPMEDVVEALEREGVLGAASPVQIVFAFDEASAAAREVPGPAPKRTALDAAEQSFAMIVRAQCNSGADLDVTVAYDCDLFEVATISRLLEHWQALLAAALADPTQTIARLPLMTAGERRLVTEDFNATSRPYSREATIHELFEAQVERTPNQIAIVQENRQWTYAELNARANRLARRLQGLGVGRGVPVAMCLERSWDMIVSLLGILKAGGAYLPLDPNYPSERLAFMLDDVQPAVLITSASLKQRLPTHKGETLCVETRDELMDGLSSENSEPASLATDLAYIMYTSGSEGIPKGVSVVHRGVVRLVQHVEYVDLGPAEVFLQVAPISFDASTFEIWGCLLHGGRLVLMPPHPPSLQEIGAALLEHRVTTLWLTSALFHQMVDNRLEDLRFVRQLCAGGDVISISHAQRVLERFPACRLINGYGPTESTTFACCHTITTDDLRRHSLPIGPPITNTRAYILDEFKQPTPIGVAGELYLGGDGLAEGYWKRPQLTVDRFVPDPFDAEDSNSRLYRTGDRARWLGDGTIEFLGRPDRQVKIRGYRVELGEIESALSRHPAVGGAAVLVELDPVGDKQLAAFVALRPGSDVTTAELRRFLANTLPSYLVPSVWRLVDSLPQSPVGKLDRRALGESLRERQSPNAPYAAPRSQLEEDLARIWGEVLGLDRIGIQDDFFECGGHSLKATAISARVCQALGIDLHVQRIFEYPTVSALAHWLDTHTADSSSTSVRTIPRAAESGRAPLSCSQQGLWVLGQVAAVGGAYNIALALHVQGPLNTDALERCLDTIVQRHAVLRTTYRASGDGIWQQRVEGRHLTLLRVDLCDTPHSERKDKCRELLTEQAGLPFDLTSDLILRAMLVRLGQSEYVLLLVVHHIAADGWSIDLLLRELGALYDAYRSGQRPNLAPPALQYADYSVWQRDWLKHEGLQTQIAYWSRQLAGAPQVTEFPTDHPRPSKLSFRGATRRAELTPELVQKLTRLGQDENSTLFMVLLTALLVLLNQRTGQRDLVVGTPSAGRNRVELEGLIGFFVNMLALRVDVSGAPSFRGLLHRVREAALGAYANQDVPFERVVEEIRPVRNLSHMPIFQIALAMQYGPRARWDSIGLQIEDWPIEAETTRYDLTIFVQGSDSGAMEIAAEYNRDLFDPSTIARLIEHWQTLLAAAVADPDRSISLLPTSGGTIETAATTGAASGRLRQHAAATRSRVAPRTITERRLAKIWAHLLRQSDVDVEDDFFELGGTSLLAIRLFAEIERAFDKRVPYTAFFQQATLANLARSLEQPAAQAQSSVVAMQSHGAGCPLFLCYSIDGGLMLWQEFVRHLGNEHPVFGFQPREVNGQPKHYERVEDIAADCVADLLAFRPQGPYCLAGFSFGGVVAYEMARQLSDQGRDVALLAAIDTLPQWNLPLTIDDLLRAAPATIWNLPRWTANTLSHWRTFPLRRKLLQRLQGLRNSLIARSMPGRQAAPAYEHFVTTTDLTERSRQMIPILFDAYLKFRPAGYPGGLSLFRARTRPLLQLARNDLGWRDFVSGEVEVVVIPGGHSTILSEPHVESLATALREKLDNVLWPE